MNSKFLNWTEVRNMSAWLKCENCWTRKKDYTTLLEQQEKSLSVIGSQDWEIIVII